jgi:hypothetical protein
LTSLVGHKPHGNHIEKCRAAQNRNHPEQKHPPKVKRLTGQLQQVPTGNRQYNNEQPDFYNHIGRLRFAFNGIRLYHNRSFNRPFSTESADAEVEKVADHKSLNKPSSILSQHLSKKRQQGSIHWRSFKLPSGFRLD